MASKVRRIEDIAELVQKCIEGASRQPRNEMEAGSMRIPSSPLSTEIMSHCFPMKLVMLNFDLYSRATNPIQYLRHYQDKMVVYSHNDLLMSQLFPSNLKRVASDWFYSLPSHSLRDFEEVR